MKEIRIGNRTIGSGHPPFVIAEMSGNHNQSLDRALEIVKAAARSGAHAFKIQTYTPDTMTLNLRNKDFMIGESNGLWKGSRCMSCMLKHIRPGSGMSQSLLRAGHSG